VIDAKTLNADIQQVIKLIDRQFGIHADDLKTAMRKIGRRLPKAAHRNAALLVEAQTQAQNPRIAVQLDEAPLKRPFDELIAAIESYDKKDAFKGRVLDILATMAFNLLLAFGLISLVVYLVR
jgi:hypothetical protein